MSESLSRRKFLQASSAAAWAAGMVPHGLRSAARPARGPYRGTFCFFSKVVPQMNWQDLAKSAKAAGFAGIDLTVRGGGHVKPQRAAEDLPKAVAAIRAEGLEVPMITTNLLTADHPTAVPILSTAAKLSIPYLKPGYYRYKFVDIRKELEEASNQFRGLVELATKYGVQVGFHNDDSFVGSQTWDISRVMDTLDPKWAGYYYDLDNGTITGGEDGWRIAACLALPRLKMVGAKDFYWAKTDSRGWQPVGCPIGQGMCNYKKFLPMLAGVDFHGPISLHMEYEVPGASADEGLAISREKCDDVMAAAKQNLDTLKSLVKEAYEGA
jgi:sugar phosphate isomerase/epimerase